MKSYKGGMIGLLGILFILISLRMVIIDGLSG
jgi:hypothetical protein